MEKQLWIEWEVRRQSRLSDWFDELEKHKMNTPEAVTLIRMARELDY